MEIAVMGHRSHRRKRLSRRLRRRRGLARHYHQGGYHRPLFQEQLEDRRMLDGAAMASLEPELMDFLPEAVPPLSIVLINDQLPWTADIISATNQNSIAIAYDGNDFSNRQLLDLLASTLSDHTAEQIESVSLFAHGNTGIVYLADNLAWTTDTLSADRELFRELDALLTDDASIYLYSCSVAGSA